MKATLYRTAAPMSTLREMVAAFPRLLIRTQYTIPEAPHRLDMKKLTDVRTVQVRGKSALKEFTPGVPVVYIRRCVPWEPLPKHDAQYMAECPVTLSLLEALTAHTEQAVVVYTPPSWAPHKDRCDETHPTAEAAKRLWNIVVAAPAAGDNMCDALGLPRNGLIMSDNLMLERMGCTPRELSSLRRTTLTTYQSRRLWKIYPRIPPLAKSLRPVYDAIMELPQVDGAYIAVGSVLRSAHNHWFGILKALVKAGCVRVADVMAMYYPYGCVPNFTKIGFLREAARASLEEVANLVEAAPLYQQRNEIRREIRQSAREQI